PVSHGAATAPHCGVGELSAPPHQPLSRVLSPNAIYWLKVAAVAGVPPKILNAITAKMIVAFIAVSESPRHGRRDCNFCHDPANQASSGRMTRPGARHANTVYSKAGVAPENGGDSCAD